jgi:hypothetical protein
VAGKRIVELTQEQIDFLSSSLDFAARAARDYDSEHRSFGEERRRVTDKTIEGIRKALASARDKPSQ